VKPVRLIASCIVLIGLALLGAAAQKPPAPVVAALQAPDPSQSQFEGELKSQSPDLWVVGEYSVLVDGQTTIIEKHGAAQVGAWLIVWALADPSGTPRAEIIVVERPAGASDPTIQFTDVLNKISDDWWIVGDNLIHVAPAVASMPTPPLGSLLSVTAVKQDMVLEAIRIQVAVEDPSQTPQDFEGTIQAMEPGRWQVEGRWVTIEPATHIDGTAAVGKHAEVRVLLQDDKSLLATLIRVPEKVEVTVGALVEDIDPQALEAEVWNVSIFPDQPYTDPYTAIVHVDGSTLVDEGRAVARAGQWADVRAESLNSHEFRAEVIRVEQTVPVTITGSFQQAATASVAGGWARIGGRTIWFPDQMATGVSAATGGQGDILIEGLLLGNGVVWAQRFAPLHEP
jgi:hypothetical protein